MAGLEIDIEINVGGKVDANVEINADHACSSCDNTDIILNVNTDVEVSNEILVNTGDYECDDCTNTGLDIDIDTPLDINPDIYVHIDDYGTEEEEEEVEEYEEYENEELEEGSSEYYAEDEEEEEDRFKAPYRDTGVILTNTHLSKQIFQEVREKNITEGGIIDKNVVGDKDNILNRWRDQLNEVYTKEYFYF